MQSVVLELLPVGHVATPKIIRDLLDEAKTELFQELVERRSKVRYPYFNPGSLTMSGDPSRRLSVFTRDLSRNGVGLLHNMDLPLESALLTMARSQGEEVILPIRIAWCRRSGDGWFISGSEFEV
jgi:hypothetical protein